MLVPALAFGETSGSNSSSTSSPIGVAGITCFWTGLASLTVATGFGVELVARPQPGRGWDEPAVTGGLIAAGVLLVGVAVYLLLADALGAMVRGLI